MPHPRLAPFDIPARRLRNNRLTGPPLPAAADVVGWMCAVQAQDYAGAKWAIGQRTRGLTDADIDRALTDGTVLRTHVLRPTRHLVLPADIRWMLRLSRGRLKATLAYYDRLLEVDEAAIRRSNLALAGALRGGTTLTRAEIAGLVGRGGRAGENQRVGHLLMHAELDAVICSGGVRGRQMTYALLDERAPETPPLSEDAALADLARRYFASHGPAQVGDFAWWSGLTVTRARRAVELAAHDLRSVTVDGRTYHLSEAPQPARPRRQVAHLLPNWDEYLVGYADRSLLVDGAALTTMPAKGNLLANSVVIDGRVVGSWRRTSTAAAATVSARLRVALTGEQRDALDRTCDRYGRFLGKPVHLTVETPSP